MIKAKAPNNVLHYAFRNDRLVALLDDNVIEWLNKNCQGWEYQSHQ